MTAFLWALVTAAIWGVVPLMEKLALAQAPPVAGVLARSLGVVAGLLLFTLGGAPWGQVQALSWKTKLLLGSGGLLASFIGQLAFYQALKSGAVSQMTPVAGAYPLVAALLGWCVLREPLTASRLAGVALVVLGVALLRK